MTDAEKMREAAAQVARALWADEDAEADPDYIADAIRALPLPPVDASAPIEWGIGPSVFQPKQIDASAQAADCQQAGLVTVGAPQITIRNGRTNDPYPEGWTLCVADNSVTYKRGGHMDIYTIEKGFLAFAARKEVMPDADQIGDSKPATSPGVTAGAAGLLDEVKAADRISDVDVAMLQSMATSFRARMGFSFNPDDMADLLTRVSAALARLEREVG